MPAYVVAMMSIHEPTAFRHASSVMRMLLVQEGGDNTEDPNPGI